MDKQVMCFGRPATYGEAKVLRRMNKTYTFHSDPGHGWLEVPVDELEELGLADKISPWSYLGKPGTAFLEEDMDASMFIDAAERAGWTVELKYWDNQGTSRIRNYGSFPSHPDWEINAGFGMA